MGTKEKILLGGLGALLPMILNLLALDFAKYVLQFNLALFLGYFIRSVGKLDIIGELDDVSTDTDTR